MSNFKIRQAVKCGYIECENFGVVDLSYPKSKFRRERCQKYKKDLYGGTCSPAITCTDTTLYRLERYEENEMNLKIKELLNEEKMVRVEDTDTNETYKIAIRKLIPEECMILQGMKTIDVDKCRNLELSDSALFKIAGNGLTSTCVQFIMEHLYKTMVDNNYVTTSEKCVEKYGRL